jgi:hypothetical protein
MVRDSADEAIKPPHLALPARTTVTSPRPGDFIITAIDPADDDDTSSPMTTQGLQSKARADVLVANLRALPDRMVVTRPWKVSRTTVAQVVPKRTSPPVLTYTPTTRAIGPESRVCVTIDECENVLFVDNPCTGESHLAMEIAAEACAKRYRVRFFRVTELVTMPIGAKDQRELARLKTQLTKLDMLVLVGLGYVPGTNVGAELLFDVIATAYERSSVMVTTNLPFENWTEAPRLGAAHRHHARPVDPSLQDHRDEGRDLPT